MKLSVENTTTRGRTAGATAGGRSCGRILALAAAAAILAGCGGIRRASPETKEEIKREIELMRRDGKL